MRTIFVSIFVGIFLVGCATSEPDRQTKLLAMASDEAQQITDPKDRLTRQLNFADQQMNRGHADESRHSLLHAAQTLRDSKALPKDPLDPQIRIAGWVSISELSRKANDTQTAESACDEAVATLHALEPVATRPEYVIGVARELKSLRGDGAAAKLLVESAGWTTKIDGPNVRRFALADIADEIFQCKDYDGGLIALRTDGDAAWRSDTLARLADLHLPLPGSGINSFIDPTEMFTPTHDTLGSAGGLMAAAAPSPETYMKPVDFHSVFQRH